ncbi:sporulation integral membrane protein YtvI [Halobacillus andaensis]|uniref:Sporulation integral membrane protein YtvI n=1 Tax=Halobacillus andaensis TaxID=1176239 RepID=A0A917AYA5_HALAA|nr:sporulation integral membrane protein YtvI [Halobacillus andaensis]MBP2002865.1 sporulation integral membrane protein YtvI [Halobacillus andaensis]GGF06244.1 sporulation integral membrane protein YtvI [Halobacillus andaensis]
MDSFNLPQLTRLLFVLLGGISLYFLFYLTWNFLFPFIIAFALSWFIQPFVRLLHERLRLPKSLAILIIIGVIVSVFVSIFAAIITRVVELIQGLSNQDFSGYVQAINVFHDQFLNWVDFILSYLKSWVGSFDPSFGDSIYRYLEDIKQRFVQFGIEQLHALLQLFSGGLANLPSILMAFGIIFLSTFFISKDWDKIKNLFQNYFSKRLRSPIKKVWSNFKLTIKQLVKAQLVLMAITMFIVFSGMLFILHPHPFLMTLLAGIIDLIPYIGTGIIFIPWIIYSFLTDQFMLTIQLSIIYMAVVICRQLFEPKILASHFGIHPLILLIGLFLGFQIWGGLAILITPIIIAFGKALITSGVPIQLWNFIMGK